MATQVFKLPESLKEDIKFSFCPGCDHGVAVRLVAEVLDELGVRDNAILTASIGCSVTLYDFMEVDSLEASLMAERLQKQQELKEQDLKNLFSLIREMEILHQSVWQKVFTQLCAVKI